MKINTACVKLFVTAVLFLFPTLVFSETFVPYESEGVDINASINVDIFSTVTLTPESVEVNQPSTVQVRVLSQSGQPLANHSIEIVATGVNITQPSSLTDIMGRTSGSVFSALPGAYTICAKDTTFGYDVEITDCKTLYVTPVSTPLMLPEPQYTKGTSNTVLWQGIGSGYKYMVQASKNSTFTNVVDQSGWISNTSYEFNELSNEQMYFYRVKARNLYGGESNWSPSVFSVQDTENPNIEVIEIGDVGENTTTEWENNFQVNMVFKVTDNLKLQATSFICVKKDGSPVDCSSEKGWEGSNLTVGVRLDQLERISGTYLYETYTFCVEASDAAGNVKRFCDISLNIPKGETVTPGDEEEPPQPKPPTKPTVIDTIKKGVDRVEKSIEDLDVVLDNTVGELSQENLETVTTATSIVTASTALTFAAGTLWEIPYFVFQAILSLLSWFGFRKKGKPLGYVYDSVTKEPISQAVVRIFNKEGKIVWSDVTDSNGYFTAQLEAGEYKIEVRSARYAFPSKIVFGKEDYPLSNVYHGENFNINESTDIRYTIPMDPLELSKFRVFVEGVFGRFKFILTLLHILLFTAGLVVSIYTYTNYPNTLNLIILLLFVPSFFLILRNIFNRKGRYGVVKNVAGERLEGVSVGLRELEFDKIVAKRVTDKYGRYRFVIGRGKYKLEVLETSYSIESVKKGIDIVVGKNETIVSRDITVKPVKSS